MRLYDRLDLVIKQAIKVGGKNSIGSKSIKGKIYEVVYKLLNSTWTGLEVRKPVTSLYAYVYNKVLEEKQKQSKTSSNAVPKEPKLGKLTILSLKPTIGVLEYNNKRVKVSHKQDVVLGMTYDYIRSGNTYIVNPAKGNIASNKTCESGNAEAYVSRVAGYLRTAYSVGSTATSLFETEEEKYVPEEEAIYQVNKDTWGIIKTIDNTTYWIETDASIMQVDLENCYKVDFTDFITPGADWEEEYTADPREYFDLTPETWEPLNVEISTPLAVTFTLKGIRKKKALLKVVTLEHLRLMLWVTTYHYENLSDAPENFSGYFSELAVIDLVILDTLTSQFKLYEAEREPWINYREISNTVIGYIDIQKDVITNEVIVLATNGKTELVTFTAELRVMIGRLRTLKDPPDELDPYAFSPYFHDFVKDYTLPSLGCELYTVIIDSDLNLKKSKILHTQNPAKITSCLGRPTTGVATFYAFYQQEVTGKLFLFRLCKLYDVTELEEETNTEVVVSGAFEVLDIETGNVEVEAFCGPQSYARDYAFGSYALGCVTPQNVTKLASYTPVSASVYGALKFNEENLQLFFSSIAPGYGETNGGIMPVFSLSSLLNNSLSRDAAVIEAQTILEKSLFAYPSDVAEQQHFFTVVSTKLGYAVAVVCNGTVLTTVSRASFSLRAPLLLFSQKKFLCHYVTNASLNLQVPIYTVDTKPEYSLDGYGNITWLYTDYKLSIPRWNITTVEAAAFLMQVVFYETTFRNSPTGVTNLVENTGLSMLLMAYTDNTGPAPFFFDTRASTLEQYSLAMPVKKEIQSYLFKFRE